MCIIIHSCYMYVRGFIFICTFFYFLFSIKIFHRNVNRFFMKRKFSHDITIGCIFYALPYCSIKSW
nr:MAG TPA: hypothetical protein [Crassvirales sp.]